MAESTLTLGFTDFQSAVGYELGYGQSSTNWSTAQTTMVDRVIQKGYRWFLYPEPIPQYKINRKHTWSFLQPVTTVNFWANDTFTVTTVGSYDSVAGTTALTATAATFENTMVPGTATVTFATTSTAYTVASWTSATEIVVTGDASAEAAEAVTVKANGDYLLPDNFGGVDGPLTFQTNEGFHVVEVVAEYRIRHNRQYNYGVNRPIEAAIRPVATHDATVGQRWEILCWPEPDSDYTMTYRYNVLASKLSSTNLYPLGGMEAGEVVEYACLAAAEEVVKKSKGSHYDTFLRRLATFVEGDSENMAPDVLGKLYDPSLGDRYGVHVRDQFRFIDSGRTVSYSGS